MNHEIKDHYGTIEISDNCAFGPSTIRALQLLPDFPTEAKQVRLIFLRNFLLVKRSAALANRDCGVLDSKIAIRIDNTCKNLMQLIQDDDPIVDELFPLSLGHSAAGTNWNMNVNEVIAYFTNNDSYAHNSSGNHSLSKNSVSDKVVVDPHDHVNLSQSTNDVMPTVAYLTYLELFDDFYLAFSDFHNYFSDFRTDLIANNILKMGRTHLRDSYSVSFSDEFESYSHLLSDVVPKLYHSISIFFELPLGGTILGTGIGAPENFGKIAVEKYLNRYFHENEAIQRLGTSALINPVLKRKKFIVNSPLLSHKSGNFFTHISKTSERISVQSNQIFINQHSSLYKNFALVVRKIANDLRIMNSGPETGFNEINIQTPNDGSSMMPGKNNPTNLETVLLMSSKILADDFLINDAFNFANFELNPMSPVIYDTFFEMVNLSKLTFDQLKQALSYLEINEAQLTKDYKIAQKNEERLIENKQHLSYDQLYQKYFAHDKSQTKNRSKNITKTDQNSSSNSKNKTKPPKK